MTLITGPLEVAHAGSFKDDHYKLEEYFVRRPGDDIAVASNIVDPETGKPSKEIAQLFAAAPDLLTTLRELVELNELDGVPYSEIRPRLAAARAVIAKATGGQE